MRRIPVGLSDEQHVRLRRESLRRGVSVGALIREAVDASYPPDVAARRDARVRSIMVVGSFESGRADISEMHDRELGEAPW